jgi:hypothetical protein
MCLRLFSFILQTTVLVHLFPTRPPQWVVMMLTQGHGHFCSGHSRRTVLTSVWAHSHNWLELITQLNISLNLTIVKEMKWATLESLCFFTRNKKVSIFAYLQDPIQEAQLTLMNKTHSSWSQCFLPKGNGSSESCPQLWVPPLMSHVYSWQETHDAELFSVQQEGVV